MIKDKFSKKFRWILLFFLFSVCFISRASEELTIDQVEKKAQILKGIEKVDYLNYVTDRICTKYPQKCIEFSFEAINISKQYNYIKGKAKALQCLGDSYQFLGKIDQAIQYYSQSLDLFLKLKDDTNIVDCQMNLGMEYNEVKNYQEALRYYNTSLAKAKKIDAKEYIAYLYYLIGNFNQSDAKLTKALYYYKKCKETYESMNHKRGIGLALYWLGNT